MKDLKKQCEELGRVVEFHREKSGLTQAGAAKLAGIGKTAVYDIEHGKTTVQFDTVLKLLSILNIRVNYEGPLMQAYRAWKK